MWRQVPSSIHTVSESGDHYVVVGRVEHLEPRGNAVVGKLGVVVNEGPVDVTVADVSIVADRHFRDHGEPFLILVE